MEYCFEQKEKNQSLQSAFKKLCPKNEFVKLQPHLSRDDAYANFTRNVKKIRNVGK